MRRFRSFVAAFGVLLAAGCHTQHRHESFLDSLRCGMSPARVTQLAHEHRYDDSDSEWLTRAAAKTTAQPKDLRHLDLTFRAGRLISVRERTLDARTKQIRYREIDLCGEPSTATANAQSSHVDSSRP
jgi:hypothetical protein